MSAKWKSPDKPPVLNKKFKLLFPLKGEQSMERPMPPKVDVAIAKLIQLYHPRMNLI